MVPYRNVYLMEGDHADLDLSGDSGAIGRFSCDAAERTVMLDLKGAGFALIVSLLSIRNGRANLSGNITTMQYLYAGQCWGEWRGRQGGEVRSLLIVFWMFQKMSLKSTHFCQFDRSLLCRRVHRVGDE